MQASAGMRLREARSGPLGGVLFYHHARQGQADEVGKPTCIGDRWPTALASNQIDRAHNHGCEAFPPAVPHADVNAVSLGRGSGCGGGGPEYVAHAGGVRGAPRPRALHPHGRQPRRVSAGRHTLHRYIHRSCSVKSLCTLHLCPGLTPPFITSQRPGRQQPRVPHVRRPPVSRARQCPIAGVRQCPGRVRHCPTAAGLPPCGRPTGTQCPGPRPPRDRSFKCSRAVDSDRARGRDRTYARAGM